MKHAAVRRGWGWALALGAALSGLGAARAGDGDLLNLSLDQLLQVQVLEGAAKYPIALRDAPAVMDVITADEIRDLAPRDLADLLSQLPSLVVQNDRIHPRLTVRGTSIPGDETTRILVLVDGHVLREHWNGSSPLSALCGVAPSQIERLEVVRGPGSVIFGSSAVWATVNIVTRDGADLRGAQWQGSVEPADRSLEWAMSWGRRRAGSDLAVHLWQIRSTGDRRAYRNELGEYDGASDAEDAISGRLRWQWRDWLSLTLAHADRTDHVPHEWYQSIAARDENRYREKLSLAEVGVRLHPRAGHELQVKAFADAYRGLWYLIYPDELSRSGWGLWMDDGADRNLGGEITYVAVYGDRLRGALGLRARQVRVEQHSGQRTPDESAWTGDGDAVPPESQVRRFGVANTYATAQLRLTGRLQGFGGLHLHRSDGEQRVTPRAGLLVDAGRGLRLRLMTGEGFRTPSIYERYYNDGLSYIANPDLRPETVRTYEVSLSRTLGPAARDEGSVPPTLTLTGYHNDLRSLVSLVEVPRAATVYARSEGYADTLNRFENLGAVRTRGVELSAQHLARGPWRGSAHVSWQRAKDESGERLDNAPTWIGGLRVSRTWGAWLAALEGRYLGERSSYAGRTLGAFATWHLQVGWRETASGSSVRLRVDNLLDARGEVALYQPDFAPLETIPSDGRRVSVQVTTRF
jgi:iron complex outermembrane receptor protein